MGEGLTETERLQSTLKALLMPANNKALEDAEFELMMLGSSLIRVSPDGAVTHIPIEAQRADEA